jgi:hypothetical protein
MGMVVDMVVITMELVRRVVQAFMTIISSSNNTKIIKEDSQFLPLTPTTLVTIKMQITTSGPLMEPRVTTNSTSPSHKTLPHLKQQPFITPQTPPLNNQ